jgi:hypothetical protein
MMSKTTVAMTAETKNALRIHEKRRKNRSGQSNTLALSLAAAKCLRLPRS